MTLLAFKDAGDGYYQIEVEDVNALPAWVANLIPCEVQTPISPSLVPQTITMRQARRALLAAGLLTAVNDAIANMTGPEGDAARIDWEFSSMVFRDATLVKSLAPALNLTDAQLDALFISAASISA